MDKDPECTIQFAGKELMVEGYGFAFHKDSPWTERISDEILRFRESGLIDQLREKWLSSRCEKIHSHSTGVARQFDVIYLSGACAFLVIGTIFSMLLFCLEHFVGKNRSWVWHSQPLNVSRNRNPWRFVTLQYDLFDIRIIACCRLHSDI